MKRLGLARRIRPSSRQPARARPGRRLRHGLVVIVWILAAAVVAALLDVGLRRPNTLVAASLRTERVQLEVFDPEAARIVFLKAKRVGSAECLDNVQVDPPHGAEVVYQRPSGQPLTVTILGPRTTTRSGSPNLPVLDRQEVELTWTAELDQSPKSWKSPSLTLEVGADTACLGTPTVRLPVQGKSVHFGAHARHPVNARDVPLMMLGGQLNVFARAMPTLLGVPLPVGSPNALYKAGELPLPGGSVIEEPQPEQDAAPRKSAVWSGYAEVDLDAKGLAAMSVEASTNASAVSVYLPTPNLSGAQVRTDAPETVSLSLLARLTGDPNLLLIYGALGVAALLLGLALTTRQLWFDSKDAS
jgi:hypothetical protein